MRTDDSCIFNNINVKRSINTNLCMFKCLNLNFGFDLIYCLSSSHFCYKFGRLDTTILMTVVGDFHDNWMSVSIL